MKTLYITDLDGTLLTGNAGLKHRTAELLKRLTANGVLFTYATARRFASAGPIMEKAEIALPVILMNGVAIADGRTGETIHMNGFEQSRLEEAKQVIEQYKETPMVYAVVDGKHRVSYLSYDTSRSGIYINDRKGDPALRPCETYEELFQGDIYYFTILSPIIPFHILNTVFSPEKGFNSNAQPDTYHNHELWYEVFSANASKANAALQLKQMLQADELVCFGDNLNDISMFEISDRCYSVSSAVPELKSISTAVIGSNENMAVPVFVEREQTSRFDYTPHDSITVEPDTARFTAAIEKAQNRVTAGIGTLNEKSIHSTLKYYFANDIDHEAKIGSFYADIVTENGIYEIQTSSFTRLNKKLEAMLNACHVTVVYPYEKRVKTISVDEKSGEVLNEGSFRTNNSYTKLFLELYRIKSFLTNPNLTICIAELDIERINYVDPKTKRRRGRGKHKKTPLTLRQEIYLEKPEDYAVFLPEGLPEEFTVKEFQKLVRSTDAKLMLEILGYMGITEKFGKIRNADLYRVCKTPLCINSKTV